jgi:hypothetical protein
MMKREGAGTTLRERAHRPIRGHRPTHSSAQQSPHARACICAAPTCTQQRKLYRAPAWNSAPAAWPWPAAPSPPHTSAATEGPALAAQTPVTMRGTCGRVRSAVETNNKQWHSARQGSNPILKPKSRQRRAFTRGTHPTGVLIAKEAPHTLCTPFPTLVHVGSSSVEVSASATEPSKSPRWNRVAERLLNRICQARHVAGKHRGLRIRGREKGRPLPLTNSRHRNNTLQCTCNSGARPQEGVGRVTGGETGGEEEHTGKR